MCLWMSPQVRHPLILAPLEINGKTPRACSTFLHKKKLTEMICLWHASTPWWWYIGSLPSQPTMVCFNPPTTRNSGFFLLKENQRAYDMGQPITRFDVRFSAFEVELLSPRAPLIPFPSLLNRCASPTLSRPPSPPHRSTPFYTLFSAPWLLQTAGLSSPW